MASTTKQKYFWLVSIVIAAILSFSLKTKSLDEQLINVAVEQNLSFAAELIAQDSLETKAILLDYADKPELVIKSWLALRKYPNTAPQLFLLYGNDEDFQKAILRFDADVIPVVDYFFQHPISTLTVQATLGDVKNKVMQLVEQLSFTNLPNLIPSITQAFTASESFTIPELTPAQRGRYAIEYLNQDGHNFLGQFAVDKDGNAQWIQTDRVTKTLASLLLGGVRGLEEKYKTKQEIGAEDMLWAGMDALVLAGSVKLLKASRAVATSKELSAMQKSRGVIKKTQFFSTKLIKSDTARQLLKYSAVGTAMYIAIVHPSIINSVLDEVAGFFGIPPELLKMLVWTVLIFLVLQPLYWCYCGTIKPLLWVIRKTVRAKTVKM
jgi:hypothetical protein